MTGSCIRIEYTLIVDQKNEHSYSATKDAAASGHYGTEMIDQPDQQLYQKMTNVYMRFTGKPINIFRRVYRYDGWTTLGSVGGSLGLFLGFSIFASLQSIQDFVFKQC